MSSQKIPLFLGLITPIHNGDTQDAPPVVPPENLIFVPPDVNLDRKNDPNNQLRVDYEVHLWLVPAFLSIADSQLFTIEAFDRVTSASLGAVWTGDVASVSPLGAPFKALDGYPLRGNVGLRLFVDIDASEVTPDLYPVGVQAYGYVTQGGEGALKSYTQRFIGAPSPDGGFSQGVPLTLPADGVAQEAELHAFAQNRYDSMSLAVHLPADLAAAAVNLALRQLDANGNDIIAGQRIPVILDTTPPNSTYTPPSPYMFEGLVLGPNPLNPNLATLSLATLGATAVDISAHGKFERH